MRTRRGLGEGADEVLADGVIDARLAADGGIDHTEQAGGDVGEGNATQDGGGGKAAQVGDDAAAKTDEEIAALDALAEEPVVDGGDGRQGLVLLAGGNGHAGGLETARAQRVEGRSSEEGTGSSVGEKEGAARESDGGAEPAEVGEGALAHDDGVARAGGADGRGDARYPGVGARAGLVPEPQNLVADLLGGEAVDIDRCVGAGVVVAACFEEGFEAGLGIAREKGPGLVGVLAGEAAGGNGGADREPNGEAVGKHLAACIVVWERRRR